MEDFRGGYCVVFLHDFYSLIDRYFMTNFPNHPCDRNILHFTSGNIMLNRLYEEQRNEQENNSEITNDLNVNSFSTILKKIVS